MSDDRANTRQTVVPYLFVEGVERLIEYCQTVFDAELRGKLSRPDGSVMHAEISIGDSVVMMGEPMGEFDPAPAWIYVTVDDCDAVYAKALDAGGTVEMEMMDMKNAGERYGGVRDQHGNVWWIASTIEDVSWEGQQRRIDALAAQELGQ